MVLPIAAAYASLTGLSGIVAFLAMFITMAFIIDRNEREHPEARPLRHPIDDTIALMKEEVEKEKEKTRRLQNTVYQLLGGLYHHETQHKLLEHEVNYLFNTESGESNIEEIYLTESMYPTTRQGDIHNTLLFDQENEINELSMRLLKAEDFVIEQAKQMHEQAQKIQAQAEQIDSILKACLEERVIYLEKPTIW
jgi:hypothetical protein